MRTANQIDGLEGGISRLIRSQRVLGPKWTDGRVTVTPVARTISIGRAGSGGGSLGAGSVLPARPGGFFVRRSGPESVLLTADGTTTRIPIVDVTRWAQIAIILTALSLLLEVWMRARTRKERS